MDFQIGDGATVCMWSDRFAATVIEASEKRVVIQYDKQELLNGMRSGEADALQCAVGGFMGHVSGAQRWSYERNEQGRTAVYTLRRNGQWIRKGDEMRGGQKLVKGRSAYTDFNF